MSVYKLEDIEEMTSSGEPYHGDMAWTIASEALAALKAVGDDGRTAIK